MKTHGLLAPDRGYTGATSLFDENFPVTPMNQLSQQTVLETDKATQEVGVYTRKEPI